MRTLLIVAACILVGCPAKPPEEPPVVTYPPDAGPDDEPFDQGSTYKNPGCASACAKLRSLKCPDGLAKPGEDSCYTVCKNAEATGKIDFKTKCIAAAQSQETVRSCGSYRCK